MVMPKGLKLCEGCRKMFPKKKVKFYPKAAMRLCTKCIDNWERKN